MEVMKRPELYLFMFQYSERPEPKLPEIILMISSDVKNRNSMRYLHSERTPLENNRGNRQGFEVLVEGNSKRSASSAIRDGPLKTRYLCLRRETIKWETLVKVRVISLHFRYA